MAKCKTHARIKCKKKKTKALQFIMNYHTKQKKKDIKSRKRSVNTENKLMVDRGEGDGGISKMGEREGKTHASSYGMNKSQR